MKQLLFLTMALATVQAQAQLNTSLAGTNKGASWQIGYLAPINDQFELDIQAGIRGSRQSKNPWVGNLSIGLPFYPATDLVITPAVGYAAYSIKDFSQEHVPPRYAITINQGFAPHGSIEVGWERTKSDGSKSAMRLFATAQYCKKVAAFGLGIRGVFR